MTKTSFDALAEHVAKKAVETETPFAEAIDALKAVTAYLTMEQKKKAPEEAPEEDGFTIDTARGALGEEGRNGISTMAAGSHRRTRTGPA